MQKRNTNNKMALALLLSVALTGFLMGCSSPIEKAYTTTTLYTQAQGQAIQLREAKQIPDPVWNEIAEADAIANPLVKEMNRAAVQAEAENIPLNKTFNFDRAYDAARKAVRVYLTRLTAAKNK